MDYDVIVIGVGTAGSRAASTASNEGARVLAIESAEEMGGLCILRGCMPTKTLLETTHRLHDIGEAKRFGIDAPPPTLDFPAQMERMRQLVARFQRAKVGGIERGGYELRKGRARFTGPNAVEVDGEAFTAKAVVIATGSVVRPFPWSVPEGTRLLTSDDMFTLQAPPTRATVFGAGAVGLEFAQWLARMGAEVTLINRSRLLSRFDPELGEELTRALGEELHVCAPSQVTTIEGEEIRCGDHTHPVGDFILNATGRVPATLGLGLEAAGLDPADLRHDEGFRTSVEHIFIAGDTTGEKAILHEANLEGEVAGRNAARLALGSGEPVAYDASTPPMSVIFTDPPVANVGLTPKECLERGIEHRAAIKHFPKQGRGIVMGAQHGFLRLVAEPDGGKILGCQIMGPRADDLIHIPAAVMRLEGTAAQMHSIPWYHPTLSEAFIEVTRELLTP